MKMALHRFSLPLANPWTLSRSTIHVRHSLVVELKLDGVRGFGEVTDNTYYNVTIDAVVERLESLRDAIEAHAFSTPEIFWDNLAPALSDATFAHSAIDAAAHDLWGKRLGKPVYALWGLKDEPARRPCTSFTLALAPLEEVLAKLDAMPGWPTYKIKLGGADDADLMRGLRAHTTAGLRVDANCGWSLDTARTLMRLLHALDVEFIEQPLPANAWEAMRTLCAEASVPLIADESCRDERDLLRCRGAFHGINIKVGKCGGLTPARRLITRARAAGLKVMVGCMVESTVGISAVAQLLPLIDYADMDGALLLAKDIAQGVRIDHGRIYYAATPGCGVELL